MTQVLMVQGTTSDAGKSVLVAGICRVLARKSKRVAPFKPQNMALNSAVTEDGGEIGRAQALQALACGIPAHTDMNPVLLKPASDTGAQVIIHGKAISDMEARAFHEFKPKVLSKVMESLARLSSHYDYVIVEGAGSPAEINLRDRDIANMGFAEAADCPVIIVADIDRGGVFAHLVGTLDLLSESEQARVKGFVINRFRGDISLLQSGLDWLEQRTGKPVLGVIPYLQGLYLDAEDAIAVQQTLADSGEVLRVVVPVYSRISNHTDFDALRLHPQVELIYIGAQQTPPACDLVILPGTKNVRKDRLWLSDNGWDAFIYKHLRYGGKVLGVCGGYQMLGNIIADPNGIEGQAGSSQGLGLLDIDTELMPQKLLGNQSGRLLLSDSPISGYEIHCGISTGAGLANPVIEFESGKVDGVISSDEQVMGTYLHGLFDQRQSCDSLLSWAGLNAKAAVDMNKVREQQLNRLADTLEQHLDFEAMGLAVDG